jgi:hypothetical protein
LVNIASNDFEGNGLTGYDDKELLDMSEEGQEVLALSSEEKCSIITKEVLVRHWGNGLDLVHQTL